MDNDSSVDKPPLLQNQSLLAAPAAVVKFPSTIDASLLPKKVGVIYTDARREHFATEALYITEKDAERDAQLIAQYIRALGIEPVLFPANEELPERLKKEKPEMVFNAVGTVRGVDFLASTIPALLELLDIPYTGAGILGESLAYNKFLVKKLMQQVGVPVPVYQLFNTASDPIDTGLRFPLISKLNEIHGAVEINKTAVSENEDQLRERLKFLINTYKQPVLVEEFIVGREITGFLLEGLNKKVYLAEKVFNKPGEAYVFATFEDQWIDHETDPTKMPFHYEKYDDPQLRELIKKAFDVCRMGDYGKFDIRMDASGRYYFIDSNDNPAFGPKESECAMSNILDMYGISFTEILKRLILNTVRDNPEDFGPSGANGNGSGNGN